jgi:integrase
VSIYKRGAVYWARFGFNGQDVRQSLGTSDWQEAKRLERKLIVEAHEGKLPPVKDSFGRLPFHLEVPDQDRLGALELYRRDRKPRLAASTKRSELDHSKPLADFFKETRVNRITEDAIRDFISKRHDAGRSNAKINKELGILFGILRRAKRWHLFPADIKRLPVRKALVGRALEHSEKVRLLHVSEWKLAWRRARLAMLLSLNTTMRAGEIRKLQWQDIDWLERTVRVRRGKTDESQREIPLNRQAYDTMIALRDDARKSFGYDLSPEWYVFYWDAIMPLDPTRPTNSWRSAWRSITRAILCPECSTIQNRGCICSNEKCEADISKVCSPIATLRFHDLRHHAITELSEGQASDETIMSIAGHIDRRMMSHYSHVRKGARRAALDRLCDEGNGEVTTDPAQFRRTMGSRDALPLPQVTERNGGDDETRTRDLCRDRAAF